MAHIYTRLTGSPDMFILPAEYERLSEMMKGAETFCFQGDEWRIIQLDIGHTHGIPYYRVTIQRAGD